MHASGTPREETTKLKTLRALKQTAPAERNFNGWAPEAESLPFPTVPPAWERLAMLRATVASWTTSWPSSIWRIKMAQQEDNLSRGDDGNEVEVDADQLVRQGYPAPSGRSRAGWWRDDRCGTLG